MNANLYALLSAHFPESDEQPCLMIRTGGSSITKSSTPRRHASRMR